MNFTISGATPVKSFDHAGTLLARFFFVQDPDGYKIEAAVPSRSAVIPLAPQTKKRPLREALSQVSSRRPQATVRPTSTLPRVAFE
jgi:hypothetical protein